MLGSIGDRQKLATTGMGVVALIAAGYIGGNYLRRPAPINIEGGLPALVQSDQPGKLVVQVSGAVKKPGVYELAARSRVQDAIKAAGGTTQSADLGSVSLAEPLTDGVKVHIPGLGEEVSTPPASSIHGFVSSSNPAKSSATGVVSLNTATLADLDTLPGIGPATAQKIIAYRSQIGGFRSIDQLLEVKGIGPKKLEKLRSQVRL